jgi:hypothetical protein
MLISICRLLHIDLFYQTGAGFSCARLRFFLEGFHPNPAIGFGSDCSERMKREARGEFLQPEMLNNVDGWRSQIRRFINYIDGWHAQTCFVREKPFAAMKIATVRRLYRRIRVQRLPVGQS